MRRCGLRPDSETHVILEQAARSDKARPYTDTDSLSDHSGDSSDEEQHQDEDVDVKPARKKVGRPSSAVLTGFQKHLKAIAPTKPFKQLAAQAAVAASIPASPDSAPAVSVDASARGVPLVAAVPVPPRARTRTQVNTSPPAPLSTPAPPAPIPAKISVLSAGMITSLPPPAVAILSEAEYESSLTALTVVELRKMLREHNLKTSGVKSLLVERLMHQRFPK